VKAFRTIVLVACGCALVVACGAIDDFSPFHVVHGDGGDGGNARDLAFAVSDGASVQDIAVVGDAAGAQDLAVVVDLAVLDLAAPCGACSPGAQRMVSCGNCGTETDTCTMACQWAAGACVGSGPCSPGVTQPGTCDQCSQQTCGNNCQWSACALKPGNACEYKGGKNFKPCNCPWIGSKTFNAGGFPVTCQVAEIGQQCLARCQWDPSCSCKGWVTDCTPIP